MHFRNKMAFAFIVCILLASLFLSGCVEKNTTGSVYFSSVPAGADIWIEGANTGYLTPATIKNIGEGNYTYFLMKEGYFDFNGTFNVELGKVTDLPQVLLTKTGSEVLIYELKYYLLENVGTLFFCDPDYYPVAREGGEQKNAIEQFFDIQNNTEEYQAILRHTNMQTIHDPSSEQKLLIYREHKKLNAVILSPSQDIFEF
ncbi:MAG: PEGA domain-containing protein [Methanosarcinaceae archaeon]|nr:PEGA domain-containing protein [Methanosarcinaceae archaeon]MDF1533007.1 PEGA domain-containing protein [Methanosarcinaceae archaeon]